ncbi:MULTISPECIES: hypothetical protein [Mycolicibacterium]|uniref:Uncharacterized protein n=1 Tax=Mycobacterium phage Bipper TaxID=1805457 RepID=A0A142F2I1_9CAUD|nr:MULTISPECIES: hypothetical protein [Mycolicibacterium]YP_009303200.1 hypothetical protein KCH39_gp124 [Mycobacterium phage Bipper]QDF19339.1 hypothetical protein SEA_CRACKLEWINK_53 [Mycobacterium phage Cracklewink]AMQ66988.1 hypothetical protein SEA_BIPPER_53 [Mycobacterium phage Bipper]MCC9181171.1 hypothetical protein [Mycolicibacterium mageritense]UBV14872.1 hypothetical protein H8Z57_29980 [Mycolicibacterium fortuitum]
MTGRHRGKRLSDRTKDRLAVLLLLMTSLGLGAVWHYAGQASALTAAMVVTVETGWTDCADLTAPDMHNQDQVVTALVCDPPGPPVTYVVHPGQMYGAAVFSPGNPVFCRVVISGREDTFQAAIGAANCLARF